MDLEFVRGAKRGFTVLLEAYVSLLVEVERKNMSLQFRGVLEGTVASRDHAWEGSRLAVASGMRLQFIRRGELRITFIARVRPLLGVITKLVAREAGDESVAVITSLMVALEPEVREVNPLVIVGGLPRGERFATAGEGTRELLLQHWSFALQSIGWLHRGQIKVFVRQTEEWEEACSETIVDLHDLTSSRRK